MSANPTGALRLGDSGAGEPYMPREHRRISLSGSAHSRKAAACGAGGGAACMRGAAVCVACFNSVPLHCRAGKCRADRWMGAFVACSHGEHALVQGRCIGAHTYMACTATATGRRCRGWWGPGRVHGVVLVCGKTNTETVSA